MATKAQLEAKVRELEDDLELARAPIRLWVTLSDADPYRGTEVFILDRDGNGAPQLRRDGECLLDAGPQATIAGPYGVDLVMLGVEPTP